MIKVTDIAYVRMGAPDLARMEQFLVDFGLLVVDRTDSSIYFRGADAPHHIYVAEAGEPRLLGVAFHAPDAADLERAAKIEGASGIEEMDEPGGGRRVRLREPNGYPVEIVHGMARLPAIDLKRQAVNTAAAPLSRKGELYRLPGGGAPVNRIGHCVLGAPQVAATARWFRDNLGLIGSDDVYAGEPDNIIGSFNRCDRGEDYVDHHTLGVLFSPEPGLQHVSFEVADFDAVLAHHHYLKGLGRYEHTWGVGRHLLGSQVFDYWLDPWGRIHERWADSDRLNAAAGSRLQSIEEGGGVQWGEDVPARMMQVTP